MRPHVVGGGFYLKAAKWKGCRPFCTEEHSMKVAKAGAWSEGGHGVRRATAPLAMREKGTDTGKRSRGDKKPCWEGKDGQGGDRDPPLGL